MPFREPPTPRHAALDAPPHVPLHAPPRSVLPWRPLGPLLGAALALLTSACDARVPGATSRSAAAEVSGEDVRRLSPARKAAMPDIIVQAADRSRMIGDAGARVQLSVISDYQCAECRVWYTTVLPEIRRRYVDAGTVQLTWVHYPLRAHPNAVRAASAALCAGSQGNDMFWAASERLFAEEARWGTVADPVAVIDSLVQSVGVEPFALRSCTGSGRLLRQIRADIDWTDKADAGAPLMVLVGTRRVTDGASLSVLTPVLDSAIAALR